MIASVGDERNALLMLTVKAALGLGGGMVTLPAARLYLLDENNKTKGPGRRKPPRPDLAA